MRTACPFPCFESNRRFQPEAFTEVFHVLYVNDTFLFSATPLYLHHPQTGTLGPQCQRTRSWESLMSSRSVVQHPQEQYLIILQHLWTRAFQESHPTEALYPPQPDSTR